MRRSVRIILAAWVAVMFLVPPVEGQNKLGKAFKKKYKLRTVTCYACHVKGEDKDVLNPFGKKIDKLIEGMHVTERLEAAKELEIEEQDLIEEEIGKEFLGVLKKLDTMKTPCGKTYAEIIAAGKIEGTKLPK
ncbi:MAG: hypothetical protein H8E44_07190 [Planctomycetes bacterium]|nr:hypothetical protein [Planctomycetota bacterium]MBL7044429.1 hypothetical protein [Pirellulaceae bacterium]